MTIYNINYGIGWASSGVEYAQLYRAKMLREQSEVLKFVFLDFFAHENLQTLTSHLGFFDDEIIWLYQYFTDIKIAPTFYTVNDLIKTLDMDITHQVEENKTIKLFNDIDNTYIVCYLKEQGKPFIDRAEFVSRGKLIRKDYYSYTRIFSEYYAPHEKKAKIYMRQFYNEDGTIAFNEYINDSSELYIFNDKILYSKQEFVAYFMESLRLSPEDIVIVDRSKGLAQPIIQNKGESKLGIVIHAEHYNEASTSEENILWNNHYEYVFKNSKEIDFYIAATDRQKDLLMTQLKKYNHVNPIIYTIPVGSIDNTIKPISRRPNSIITASRLASEKHIDWLIKAVVIVKKSIDSIEFDIYGEGGQRNTLQKIIEENDACDYISLLGHVDLKNVYSKYELFLSGSTSEGFGLTLMEAIGSGLGMIGFKVEYGNTTFISDDKNGYLIPININNHSEKQIVDSLANSIIKFFESDRASYHQHSYEIAETYKTQNIKYRWFNLIEEVLYD
ncbi:accessory Sec system glycosyltransferase GtfA [Mammaliicoccus sciuri]|uniref:accessory Sec system glycosyltransferase GtfA n=1 Tax=Bacillota TaxID=1239 RepID=UPI00065B9939|nr:MULTISPECIES: accessory Sec system glycosyltransferase GtfA [Bacillota]MCJ0917206.1 accessory Sec system glycosyltransferase GtfA [Mammaliicoccus sciuri]MCJ0938119.1 accessory Sec system glycosyltransferase GtfA [Mammaliicoccus sciuri]PNY97191.1 accessory Sec system glycosyltransferase GtfA [Mammaliicoccus sciuri]PTJ56860.1 accessory Sec system glycosyltransferase GtfA [Mammaliicoccus sciuri]PTJ75675.1 accessory Sec system glycosyltransferase GtfA [Mammaliicoccus sciuri]